MISNGNETLLIQKHTICGHNGVINDRNKTLLMQTILSASRNVQGTFSDGNETLSVQKHTFCEQKCAADNQRQEWDSVDTDTYFLGAQCTGDDQRQG